MMTYTEVIDKLGADAFRLEIKSLRSLEMSETMLPLTQLDGQMAMVALIYDVDSMDVYEHVRKSAVRIRDEWFAKYDVEC